jgi:hypothetical protein
VEGTIFFFFTEWLIINEDVTYNGILKLYFCCRTNEYRKIPYKIKCKWDNQISNI